MAAGVALAKTAGLGTSPIASIPNVLSFIFNHSIGQFTILYMILLITLEALVLRHDFSWRNLVQLIPAIFFGFFIDGFVQIFQHLSMPNYGVQVLYTCVSIPILAFGVFLEVHSQSIIMPGEGIVAAITFVFDREFPKVKVKVDTTMVIVAVILALAVLHRLTGVREGTVLSALVTGRILDFYNLKFDHLTKWLATL